MLRFQQNVPLAQFTTIGIGGPAKHLVRVEDVDALREALDWARQQNENVFLLGGGSNLLISDAGFDGLVIHVDLRGVTIEVDEGEFAMVKAAAGEPWDPFVALTVEHGWAGVECLSGIPGSTGATPIQNVGAYGQDVSETIVRVEALDRTTGLVTWFTNWDCRFGYRASLFKNHEPNRYVVLSVTFRLRRNGSATVRYPELRKYMEEQGIALDDLMRVREAVIAIRKRKGMVIDAKDPDTRSDGSFFMNPIVTPAQYEAFARIAPDAPHFDAGGGDVKLSAAWLIEHAGFHKGFVHGNAGLSSKHTLAVINRGGATAAEVLELVRMIQDKVRDAFGVEMHPEPNFIGF
ncbi:MAG TPA: UDP-N-acetylmuramate dehydrogenase [Thermoanaerobaculia bacterium]|nr:UDP-N-acetylmuramate dehydrogenase [Thermoanaerobaculia bacterium]